MSTAVNNFLKRNLKKELSRGMENYGIENLTIEQKHFIILCIKEFSITEQALTHKASTISISVLQLIDTSLNECQALILVPSVKLGLYIEKIIKGLSIFMKVYCHACIAGKNMRNDMSKLDTKPHVVVGTPRLVHDMIARKSLGTKFIKFVAIHKADEMSRSFKDQTENVIELLPDDIQIFIMAATMPNDVLDMSSRLISTEFELSGNPTLDDKFLTDIDKITTKKY